MDANQVETLCAAAAQLVPALVAYASIEASQRETEDDALIRQLRVAVGALHMALVEVPRQSPPMPMMPAPVNVGAPS
jgi:hypothetical protein